jgi:hypothetical protein
VGKLIDVLMSLVLKGVGKTVTMRPDTVAYIYLIPATQVEFKRIQICSQPGKS